MSKELDLRVVCKVLEVIWNQITKQKTVYLVYGGVA
jgi:hypothetical protein